MKTFSRPEISGWKPAPSSISAEMRPSTFTVPSEGLVIPATSFKSVLFPDPLRPMTPSVRPLGTVRLTSFSAVNVSSGPQVPDQAARQQGALQRRELLALAVAAVDLRNAGDFDGWRHHTSSANESRRRSKIQ
jgi:hypothetical protein